MFVSWLWLNLLVSNPVFWINHHSQWPHLPQLKNRCPLSVCGMCFMCVWVSFFFSASSFFFFFFWGHFICICICMALGFWSKSLLNKIKKPTGAICLTDIVLVTGKDYSPLMRLWSLRLFVHPPGHERTSKDSLDAKEKKRKSLVAQSCSLT